MDKEQIQGWLDYCQGKLDEPPYIGNIFMEMFSERLSEHNKEDLNRFFSVVPNSERVLQRMLLLDENMSSKTNDQISVIVRDDLNEMKKIIRSPSIMTAMMEFPIAFTIDDDFYDKARNSKTYSQYYYELANYFSPIVGGADPIKKIVCQAFYGVAFNVNLENALTVDLLHLDLNFDYYYELYKIGVDYVLSDDAIVVMNYREKAGTFIP
jgi:hypothetical protein